MNRAHWSKGEAGRTPLKQCVAGQRFTVPEPGEVVGVVGVATWSGDKEPK